MEVRMRRAMREGLSDRIFGCVGMSGTSLHLYEDALKKHVWYQKLISRS